MKFEPGTIARCRHGYLGLVTHVHKRKEYTLYVGFHLASDGRAGKPWQSRDPKYVGHVNEIAKC